MNDLWEKAVKKLTTYCAKGKRQQYFLNKYLKKEAAV